MPFSICMRNQEEVPGDLAIQTCLSNVWIDANFCILIFWSLNFISFRFYPYKLCWHGFICWNWFGFACPSIFNVA